MRSLLIGVMAFILAAWWPIFGLLVFAKLIVIGILIAAAYFALGEFNHHELSMARSIFPWPMAVPGLRRIRVMLSAAKHLGTGPEQRKP